MCIRHGLRMLRNPWADGPSYVTQCPIQPGGSYTYRFRIRDQEGTLWWHAHTGFLRATVYGAFIIYPRLGSAYPFSVPKQEFPLILGTSLKSSFAQFLNSESPSTVNKLYLTTKHLKCE